MAKKNIFLSRHPPYSALFQINHNKLCQGAGFPVAQHQGVAIQFVIFNYTEYSEKFCFCIEVWTSHFGGYDLRKAYAISCLQLIAATERITSAIT